MKESYTKLMAQQEPSPEADAAFYEKLETTNTVKMRKPVWKAAIVAVCIFLLIPMTVWAAESIFGVTKVTLYERPVFDNKPGIGLEIQYENLEDYSITDFSKQIQELEEGGEILHYDWASAEEHLGIDLIDNTLFTDEDTKQMAAYGERGKHCQGIYYVWDGQFSGAKIGSVFQRGNTRWGVSAMVIAEHPAEYDEIVQKYYHGVSMAFAQYPVREVTVATEQYVTQAGIPVLLVTVTREPHSTEKWADFYDCMAFFAVNNISYRVGFAGSSYSSTDLDASIGPAEKYTAELKEFLDGFTLE